MVLRNSFASFFATLANVFLYAVGDSMRGMAMSLANRPYLLGNGLAEKAMAEETKSAGMSGTQRAAAENGVRGAVDDFAVRDDVGVQWLVISVVKQSNCVFRS